MFYGIDLGGTKIEILALDRHGFERFRKRVATPQGDYAATLAAICALVEEADRALNCRGSIGVGTPGAISHVSGKIKNSNSTCLNGQPLRQDLERILSRSVRLANDANCFTLSEAVDGAGVRERVVFGVIVGTGTGGGIVVDGALIQGANSIAGEWGHNPLPWSSDDELCERQCYCGKRGCIEMFLSGPALERDFAQGETIEVRAQSIARRAQQGEQRAIATLERYEDRMARALASVINILDPDVIVLGGGVSNIARLYVNVPNIWGRYVFSDECSTRLVPARHGDSGGVRGAAWLWNDLRKIGSARQ